MMNKSDDDPGLVLDWLELIAEKLASRRLRIDIVTKVAQ